MKQKLFKLVALAAAYSAPLIAAAQIQQIGTDSGIIPTGSVGSAYTFGNLLNTGNALLNITASLIVALSVIFIIYGGFTFITSGGDETKVTEARNRIIYGVIGIAIIILAGLIFTFVGSILNTSTTTLAQ